MKRKPKAVGGRSRSGRRTNKTAQDLAKRLVELGDFLRQIPEGQGAGTGGKARAWPVYMIADDILVPLGKAAQQGGDELANLLVSVANLVRRGGDATDIELARFVLRSVIHEFETGRLSKKPGDKADKVRALAHRVVSETGRLSDADLVAIITKAGAEVSETWVRKERTAFLKIPAILRTPAHWDSWRPAQS